MIAFLTHSSYMPRLVSPGPWLTGLSNGCGATRWQGLSRVKSLYLSPGTHRVIRYTLATVSLDGFVHTPFTSRTV